MLTLLPIRRLSAYGGTTSALRADSVLGARDGSKSLERTGLGSRSSLRSVGVIAVRRSAQIRCVPQLMLGVSRHLEAFR